MTMVYDNKILDVIFVLILTCNIAETLCTARKNYLFSYSKQSVLT